MGFEENLKKLEKIVDDLHGEKVPLEKALEKFEEGIKLVEACAKTLDQMRKKIEVVTRTKDGKIKIKSFEEEDDHA